MQQARQLFQFQTGSIKRKESGEAMMRAGLFQFQTGSIKSINCIL